MPDERQPDDTEETDDGQPTDDDSGGDDGGDGGGGDGGKPKAPTVESLQAELSKARSALRKANREAARARKAPAPVGDKAEDPEKVRQEIEQAAAGRWKPQVVKAHARTAFIEAGLVLPKDNHDAAMARVLKLLDLDDLEITDDGQVDGLRDQVEEIRRDFPELFATTNGKRVPRVDGSDRGAPPAKAKTSAETLAALLTGARR